MPARAAVSKPAGDWNAVAEGQIVDCMVTKVNKGGLEVNVSNLRGFLPAGQVDLVFCSNLEQFIGQKLRVKVTEVKPHKKNLIVSRRSFLEIAIAELREEAWKTLEVGQKRTGTVKTLKDYGAFVELEQGIEGLVHVSEMTWSKRMKHPSKLVNVGDEIECVVLNVNSNERRISLGLKQLESNPWERLHEKYPIGSTVEGRVRNLTDFGAFIELEPGVPESVRTAFAHGGYRLVELRERDGYAGHAHVIVADPDGNLQVATDPRADGEALAV
jgi:small subunit ribosomal protein S1